MTNKIDYYLNQFLKEAQNGWFKNDAPIKEYETYFKKFFESAYIENLDEKKVAELVKHIHSFKSLAIAGAKASKLDNNSLKKLKETFSYLTKDFETDDKYAEMNERLKNSLPAGSKYSLMNWGISSITEIIGQRFPDTFVFYNRRDQEAVKFLGIEIKKSKEEIYIRYNRAIQPVIERYKELVSPYFESGYPIGIEIDQFFSWVYKMYVVGGTGTETEVVLYERLTKIEIANYFSLKNVILDKLSNEVYILGENGVGKTLLLQAIFLSTKFQFIKEESNKSFTGEIDQLLRENQKQNEENSPFTFATYSSDDSEDLEKNVYTNKVDPKPEKEKTPMQLKNIFAYGVNRHYNPRADKSEYEFMTLFSNKYSLADPMEWLKNLFIRELVEEKKKRDEVPPHVSLKEATKMIGELLDGDDKRRKVEIEVNQEGVLFKENGAQMSFAQLSDGYKSVMTWLIDMLALLSKNQPNISKIQEFEGVLLIDELDLFLHPRWSYSIVNKLRKWLPRFQFIITTHNPILTLGASEDAIFYKLYREEGETKISNPLPLKEYYKNVTANSFMTSLLWGLDNFEMRGSKSENTGEEDYITHKLHERIKKIVDKPEHKAIFTDEDLMKVITEELAKIDF